MQVPPVEGHQAAAPAPSTEPPAATLPALLEPPSYLPPPQASLLPWLPSTLAAWPVSALAALALTGMLLACVLMCRSGEASCAARLGSMGS